MKRLNGKTAVITGAASGFGAGMGMGQVMAASMSNSLAQTMAPPAAAGAPAAAPAAPAPSMDEVIANIEKLHGLVGKGILSQAEFEAKKVELLKKLS